jgi:type VI secretion system protein ImpG
MDRRLLGYYNRELQHLRESGTEFAREFPKIAGRLALEEFTCADPYVERLLEGFAFLAARVHLKLDSEFPRFTQSLLETVYPHYLAPTPSMLVAQLKPSPVEGTLNDGMKVPRNTALRSEPGKGATAACEYRTAHEITLWPIEVASAKYYARDLGTLNLPDSVQGVKAAIQIELRATGNARFDQIALDKLPLFIRGSGGLQMQIYEQIFRHGMVAAVAPKGTPRPWWEISRAARSIAQVGFDDDQAMIPFDARSFHGHRLLHEYFAFPQRYLFVELSGLSRGVRRCNQQTLDVFILLREADLSLEGGLDASNFALFCTPAINLFPKRADRIHVTDRHAEFHVIPDRTRPKDFEVYRINSVTGFGARPEEEQVFAPFYSAKDESARQSSYYVVHRVPRMTGEHEERRGKRARYDGSDVYISLVDSESAPFSVNLRQLGVDTLCTNRDLPLLLPTGSGETDFYADVGAPIESVRCVSGVPTAPKPAHASGEYAWRLISHLTLNYLSLTDGAGQSGDAGASALRDLLELYGDVSDPATRKQIQGLRTIRSRPVVRRLTSGAPIAFGRGLEITTTFDEAAFEGSGVFLLGAVLERFFARYVSINSFTATVVNTIDRGEVMRWPARLGKRQIL